MTRIMKRLAIILGILVVSTPALQAQCEEETPGGNPPIAVYSIFLQNFNNGDYEFALGFGKWMINCDIEQIDGTRYNLPKHYERMIAAYGGVGEKSSDPGVKAAYIDTALTHYDMALDKFQDGEIDPFEWKLKKARLIQKHYNVLDGGIGAAYEIYEELFYENPEKMMNEANGYYFQIILQNRVSKSETEEALKLIEAGEPFADDATKEAIDQAENRLFRNPEDRIGFISEKLDADPNNLDLLKELGDLYEKVDDLDNAIEITRRVYALEPTYENAKTLGDIAKGNANTAETLRFYKEAYEKATEESQKETMALEISDVYLNTEDLRQARTWSRNALKHNAKSGQAFIKIARVYAAAVSQCTSSRKLELEDRVVYWLVLDYLDRAKREDPSVSSLANNFISSYTPVVPTTENKFFKNWSKGDKLKVDASLNACYDWVNETTAVR